MKHLSRMFGGAKEEKLVAQVKVSVMMAKLDAEFDAVFLEWKRGDTVERTSSAGGYKTGQASITFNHIFNKLSIFYKTKEDY